MQRLTITFEDERLGKITTSFEACEIRNDDLFWMFFSECWTTLGMDFVKKEIIQ